MNNLNSIILPGSRINPKNNIQNLPANNQSLSQAAQNATAFSDILNQKISQHQDQDQENSVQFSKHANMRLDTRDINLSQEQIRRIENAVDTANQKGIADSLVLVDDIALVVNVKSRTVVTALNHAQQNVFTNIDGAVIV